MDNMENTHIEEVNLDSAPQTAPQKVPQNSFFSTVVKGIALVIGLFIFGNIIGSLTNIQYENTLHTDSLTTLPTVTDTTLPSITVPSTETTTEIEEITTVVKETTTESTTAQTTTKVTTTKETTTAVPTTEDTEPDTKEEIVELFNMSANKIKKNATKIIRNYDDKRFDEDKSEYPRVLNLVGTPLINSFLVKNDTPVEYTEEEIIKANYPVKGKDWVSKLTPADVAQAKCIEKDGNYEIELLLLYCKDPEENTGVCAAMEEITLETIQELAPVVKSCSVEYYDCVIRCTIEKDSGNMIYAKYVQPMALSITTQALTERHALFAMTFESEYVIEY